MQLGTLVCLPKPRAHQGRVTTQAEFVQGSHRRRVPVQGPEDSNKVAPDWLSVRRCSCSRPREVDAIMCLLRAFERTRPPALGGERLSSLVWFWLLQLVVPHIGNHLERLIHLPLLHIFSEMHPRAGFPGVPNSPTHNSKTDRR